MRYVVFIIGIVFTATSFSQSITNQIRIKHAEFSEPLTFNVALPSGYKENGEKRYPMMFDFHPQSMTYLQGMHDWLSHNAEWPWLQTIIVTPATGNSIGRLFDATGRTTPLLDFFANELFPHIDKTYRTNGFRIFSGFRHNGSLVMSALFRQPDMFDAYFAGSVELKDNFAGLISDAEASLKALDERPRFLLFSYAETVKDEHQLREYQYMEETLQQFAPSSLTYHTHNFRDNYHMSIPLLTTIMGIEYLFDDIHNGLAPESAISQQGVEAIVAHYDYLSKQKYGFAVSPKHSIRRLGNALLEAEPDRGLAVLQQLVVLYPDDPYSYHYVAEAFAKRNDIESAIEYQHRAIDKSKHSKTWHQKKFNKALKQYSQRREVIHETR